MGRIPVFLYDDIPWIPYNGTNISCETFGYQGGLHAQETLHELVWRLGNETDSGYQKKLQKLIEVRKYFTYSGVVEQIEKLIKDPFGESGYLRCIKHPHTEKCCG